MMPNNDAARPISYRDLHATGYAVSPYGSVWMTNDTAWISAARAVAVDAMRVLGMDETDWRTRDKIIMAISDRINGMLDYARHNNVSERTEAK